MKKYRGVNYYQYHKSAQLVVDSLQRNLYPMARIVKYQRGYAVQYRISGPYYPEYH